MTSGSATYQVVSVSTSNHRQQRIGPHALIRDHAGDLLRTVEIPGLRRDQGNAPQRRCPRKWTVTGPSQLHSIVDPPSGRRLTGDALLRADLQAGILNGLDELHGAAEIAERRVSPRQPRHCVIPVVSDRVQDGVGPVGVARQCQHCHQCRLRQVSRDHFRCGGDDPLNGSDEVGRVLGIRGVGCRYGRLDHQPRPHAFVAFRTGDEFGAIEPSNGGKPSYHRESCRVSGDFAGLDAPESDGAVKNLGGPLPLACLGQPAGGARQRTDRLHTPVA
jgi:hypothetical protein